MVLGGFSAVLNMAPSNDNKSKPLRIIEFLTWDVAKTSFLLVALRIQGALISLLNQELVF